MTFLNQQRGSEGEGVGRERERERERERAAKRKNVDLVKAFTIHDSFVPASETDRHTDRQTDGQMIRQTDRASYTENTFLLAV